jgi:hypothetical protein
MQDPDSVHPDDALLHRAFASMVEHIRDPAKKDVVTDFLITARPLAEWSKEELDTLLDICTYVVSLSRMSCDVHQLTQLDAPDSQTSEDPHAGPDQT